MSWSVDLRTAILFGALLTWLTDVLLMLSWNSLPRAMRPSLRWWLFGMALHPVGFLLIGLRDTLPDVLSVVVFALIGFVPNFWVAVVLLVLWGLMFSAVTPIRQGYINALIPSQQRATVLSFDSLFGSTGGVVIQPMLGKAAPEIEGEVVAELVADGRVEFLRRNGKSRHWQKGRYRFVPGDAGIFDGHVVGVGLELNGEIEDGGVRLQVRDDGFS